MRTYAARPVAHLANALAGAFVTALATALAVAGLAAVTAAPAAAHDQIISSDPADGTALAVSPSQITLTFSDSIQSVGGQVVVADAAGAEAASGAPAVEGPRATLVLPTLANGAYSVTWRVVSSDGHPIDGTFGFTVDDPAAEEPAVEDPAVEEPAVEPTPEVTALDSPEPGVSPAPADEAIDENDDGLPWPGIIIGALLGLAAGTVLMILSKRRTP